MKNAKNKTQRPYFSGTVHDFTLSEDMNLPKAKKLLTEAREAMNAENYALAIAKYDAALAFYPQSGRLKEERALAQRLLNNSQKPKFNPMRITVPDDFLTIEEAYANVKDGGIISIEPGKYELSATLEVNRSVTFRGSSGRPEDVAIDCPSSDAFQIVGGSPSFQNLTASSGAETCGGFYVTGGTPKLFRCIVTSRKGSGMYIKGEKANPQVESCTIKNCGECGVLIQDKGLGEFRDCEIYGNAYAGIQVRTSGNPTVTGCKIHDGKQGGVLVNENGLGEFRDCEIYGNAMPGIAVATSGNPTVTGCKIHDGKAGGVFVLDKGLGSFSDCEIYGNAYAGIEVIESGIPTVTGCKIHDGKVVGVFVWDKGLGEFRDCEIYGNALAGIQVATSGNPTVTGCKIHDGKNAGVFVNENGLGEFSDCEIYGNAKSGIQVRTSGNPTVTGCKIHDGKAGVIVYDKGMGTFNNNTLKDNYVNGKLYNWIIDSSAGKVSGYGNTPPMP